MKYPPDDPKLTAYALGELDPGEAAAVATAVENSDECRRAVEETRATAGRLMDALQTETCPELSAAQRSTIEAALATAATRSAGFQPAVSRVSNPPGVREDSTHRRLEVGNTAGWKPALRTGAKRAGKPVRVTSVLSALLAWRPQFGTVVLWATACLIAVAGWGLWVEVFCRSGCNSDQQAKAFAIRLNPKPATTQPAPPPPPPPVANSLARHAPVASSALAMTTGGTSGPGNPVNAGAALSHTVNWSTFNGGFDINNNGAVYQLGGGNGVLNYSSGTLQTGGATANSLALTVHGGGTLTLGNPNAGHLLAVDGIGSPLLFGGNTLQASGTAGSSHPHSYDGRLTCGSGTPALAGNITFSGPTIINNGSLQQSSATPGNAPNANAGATLNTSVLNGLFNQQRLGVEEEKLSKRPKMISSPLPGHVANISPNNSIDVSTYKLGPNMLVLDGNNTFRGGVILGAGRLSTSAPVSFAGGVLVVSNPSDVTVNVGFNATPVCWAGTPFYTTTQHDTETYAPIRDNPFLAVAEHPLSTFSIDVDTASYSNVRRFLLQDRLPPPNAVRIEEMINYFSYDYAKPKDGEPFSVNIETAGCPWDNDHRLVRIGLKGQEIAAAKRPPCNLVFLIDVSGSMGAPNKLALIKPAMRLLVEQLTENERVAIVVFNDTARVLLPSTSGNHRQEILDAMESLKSGGCTNGGDGLRLAYEMARRHFIEHGVNRVILCTDGDFNAGNIVNLPDLTRLIERERQTGVFLTALGFGMGNLKDATLERLADKGNGHYAYIDTFFEARKVLVEQLNGTLVTIAKDVKIQVEFNPAKVAGYRLIGYEDRLLRKEDFNNDRKDAGEIGAGHTVTALYEIVPADRPMPAPTVDPLKYQPVPKPAPPANPSNEWLTVKLRYKQPDGDKSALIEQAVTDSGRGYAAASRDFKFASAVAAFGMVLRDSPHKGGATLAGVLELAEEGRGPDPSGYRTEFLSLVKKAKALSGK